MKQFLILATTFLIASCVDIERGNPEDPGSRNYHDNRLSSSLSVVPSSSSAVVSSSSVSVVSSSSVAVSSSSAMESSSSVEVVSSSSVEMSCSSAMEYSSSSMLSSSSSALPSSSSIVPSSSSAMTSSSSAVVSSSSSAVVGTGLCAGFVDGTPREHYGKSKAQFCDPRDGKKYVYVTIGTQTWMAENLNYAANKNRCYEGIFTGDDCDKYGRLYDWGTATANSASSTNGVKGICSIGWHLPSKAEWETLIQYINPNCSFVGNCDNVGNTLKTTSGWSSYIGDPFPISGNGTDNFGFSALPGGEWQDDFGGRFAGAGYSGTWWSSTESSADKVYLLSINYSSDVVSGSSREKSFLQSVRCVRD